jgi:hypothetical protein
VIPQISILFKTAGIFLMGRFNWVGVQVKDELFYVKFFTVGYHLDGSLVGVSLLVAGKGFLGAEVGGTSIEAGLRKI